MEVAQKSLELLQVDRLGLDHIDHKLLIAIIDRFRGGPVGLETIAATIGEEAPTIEDVYEPYCPRLDSYSEHREEDWLRSPLSPFRGREVPSRLTGMAKLLMIIGALFLLSVFLCNSFTLVSCQGILSLKREMQPSIFHL